MSDNQQQPSPEGAPPNEGNANARENVPQRTPRQHRRLSAYRSGYVTPFGFLGPTGYYHESYLYQCDYEDEDSGHHQYHGYHRTNIGGFQTHCESADEYKYPISGQDGGQNSNEFQQRDEDSQGRNQNRYDSGHNNKSYQHQDAGQQERGYMADPPRGTGQDRSVDDRRHDDCRRDTEYECDAVVFEYVRAFICVGRRSRLVREEVLRARREFLILNIHRGLLIAGMAVENNVTTFGLSLQVAQNFLLKYGRYFGRDSGVGPRRPGSINGIHTLLDHLEQWTHEEVADLFRNLWYDIQSCMVQEWPLGWRVARSPENIEDWGTIGA